MSAESDLYAILDADVALQSLVLERIYPDVMPEGTPYPAVMFSRTASDPVVTLDNTKHADFVELTLQSWARDRAASIAVDDALETALLVAGETPSGALAIYDEELDLYGMQRTVILLVTA